MTHTQDKKVSMETVSCEDRWELTRQGGRVERTVFQAMRKGTGERPSSLLATESSRPFPRSLRVSLDKPVFGSLKRSKQTA